MAARERGYCHQGLPFMNRAWRARSAVPMMVRYATSMASRLFRTWSWLL
jgi:hypothetical protein